MKKKRISRNINLTEGSISQGIIYFAIPLLLTNFLQQLYNTADLMIVGRFAGKNPMAAVGATGPMSTLLIGLFMGLTTGASVVISQYYGSLEREHLKKSVHSAYFLAIASGLLITFFGYVTTPFLLRILDTPQEIMEDAVCYMRIFFFGTTPLLVYNMGASVLRSIGDSKRPFRFLCIAALVNIVLDLIFIAGFHLSVMGAGWATFFAQLASAVMVTFNLMKSERIFKLTIKEIKFYREEALRIFEIGIPTGIQSSLISLSNVIIQAKINGFGADAIAGVAAEGRIDGFIFLALQAVSLAGTTFAGQNFGARKKERIREGVKVTVGIVLALAVALSLVCLLFSRQLIAVFNSNDAVVEYGSKCLVAVVICVWAFAVADTLSGFIRGAGYAVGPMVISMITVCGLRILWVFGALQIWNTIDIVFYSYPISYVSTLLLTAVYFKFGKWRKVME